MGNRSKSSPRRIGNFINLFNGILGDKRPASGNVLTQEFCAHCGTPVLGRSSARPQFRTLRFGLLDEGHGLRPQAAIWTDEAPEWAVIDPALEQFAQQPPAPPAPPAAD